MSADLSKIIVIDLEATCWEDGNHNRKDGQISEITEIGIAVINRQTNSIIENTSIFVKPEYSKVSDFCTKLTGITQEKLDVDGVSFSTACSILKKDYRSFRHVFVSWGDYDRIQIQRDCTLKKVRSPFDRTHINLKNIFALHMGLTKECGVMEATKLLNLNFQGNLHSGKDDAYNTAKIYTHIFKEGFLNKNV